MLPSVWAQFSVPQVPRWPIGGVFKLIDEESVGVFLGESTGQVLVTLQAAAHVGTGQNHFAPPLEMEIFPCPFLSGMTTLTCIQAYAYCCQGDPGVPCSAL